MTNFRLYYIVLIESPVIDKRRKLIGPNASVNSLYIKNSQAYTCGRYTDLIVPNLAVFVHRQKRWRTRAWKYFARDSGTLYVTRGIFVGL